MKAYSDQDLEFFRKLILSKLEPAITDLAEMTASIRKADSNGTDDTLSSYKPLEDGNEALSTETLNTLAARQEKFVQNLKNALIRIDNKTYGVCRVTGNLIAKERLISVPHATLSIEAKNKQDNVNPKNYEEPNR